MRPAFYSAFTAFLFFVAPPSGFAENGTAEVCSAVAVESTSLAYSGCKGLDEKLLATATVDTILKILKPCRYGRDYVNGSFGQTAWKLSQHPRFEVRLAAHAVQLMGIAGVDEFKDAQAKTLKSLRSFLKTSHSANDLAWKTAEEVESKVLAKSPSSVKTEVNRSAVTSSLGLSWVKSQAESFCAEFRAIAPACADSFRSVLDEVHPEPYAGYYVSMRAVVSKFFNDERNYRGVVRAALELQAAIDRREDCASGKCETVFSSLAENYRKEGFSPREAENAAFTILGIYGSRGASLDLLEFVVPMKAMPALAALELISTGMTVLDGLRVAEGATAYSLPAGIRNECTYGKQYRFWLPAYLAFSQTRKGVDRESALVAVHLTAMGYEFNSNTLGRDGVSALSPSASRSFRNANMINLAFSGAGAVFGATQSRYRLDSVLSFMFFRHEPPTESDTLFRSPLARFHDWSKLLLADVSLNPLYRN